MKTSILTSRIVAALVCAGCLSLWSARALHAADDPAAPAKDAPPQKSAIEERMEEERKLAPAKYGNYSGTVTLLTDAEIQLRGDDAVIAKFATGGGDLFLKPDNDEIKAIVKASNGKSLTVKGKYMSNGKYIFVWKTVETGPATGFVAPAGGL